MPTYAILDLKIFDKEILQQHKNVASNILKKYGGKIIIRGGKSKYAEGNWNPERVDIFRVSDL